MNKIDPNIIEQLGLSDEQFNALEKKYALIEPIVSEYTSPEEKQNLRINAQIQLGKNARTIRQYVSDFKQQGIAGLIRQKRIDKNSYKVFFPEILTKAKLLLKENPYRSVNMLVTLLKLDSELKEKTIKLKQGILYYHLKKSGYNFKCRKGVGPQKIYRKFEAAYGNFLWQGDARHGIEVEHPTKPNKKKRAYLFMWLDDYSRKIIYAKYYFDEKTISLEDSFRQAVLRAGIPEKIYVDNGSAYISKQFTIATNTIGTRKIHHPPYMAHCKGKVEIEMKKCKRFQEECVCAGIKTIDELNQTLWSWIEIEHNQKILSTTGETPNERYKKSIIKHQPKRITNLELFNSCFLWKESRIITKYGTISINKNNYKVKEIAPGEKVEILFDPCDLTKIFIYYKGKHHSIVQAYKLTRAQYSNIPEEKKKSSGEISIASRTYFEEIRKKHQEQKNEDSDFGFSNIISEQE